MRVLAPAKINLHLRVAPRERSGFHPLMSWMCTVGLFDTLTIEPADTGISLTCDDPALACDQSNLVMRAALALRNEAPHRTGATIHLEKRIPSGGGLGGGSSDAARTLLALNRLWKLDWPLERLARISAALGSDVLFFLSGPSAVCTGRGEVVRPIAAPTPHWALLVMPGIALPTAAVYQKFDEMNLGSTEVLSWGHSMDGWTKLPARDLLAKLVNDLEPPAFALCPPLQALQQDVQRTIGRIVRMTGSGSTLFSLFDESAEAKSAAAHIEDRHGAKTALVEIAPRLADDLDVVRSRD